VTDGVGSALAPGPSGERREDGTGIGSIARAAAPASLFVTAGSREPQEVSDCCCVGCGRSTCLRAPSRQGQRPEPRPRPVRRGRRRDSTGARTTTASARYPAHSAADVSSRCCLPNNAEAPNVMNQVGHVDEGHHAAHVRKGHCPHAADNYATASVLSGRRGQRSAFSSAAAPRSAESASGMPTLIAEETKRADLTQLRELDRRYAVAEPTLRLDVPVFVARDELGRQVGAGSRQPPSTCPTRGFTTCARAAACSAVPGVGE
jgi:hypothetical protein